METIPNKMPVCFRGLRNLERVSLMSGILYRVSKWSSFFYNLRPFRQPKYGPFIGTGPENRKFVLVAVAH